MSNYFQYPAEAPTFKKLTDGKNCSTKSVIVPTLDRQPSWCHSKGKKILCPKITPVPD